MPFITAKGNRLKSIELGQVPLASPTFQVRRPFGWYEEGTDPESALWVTPPRRKNTPGPGERTDLASVPALFWSLIASYGRQTAPAVLHDSECWKVKVAHKAGEIDSTEALARRNSADRNFRLGLRELDVAPFRAWLMWTFVSFERYQKHSIPKFIGMLGVAFVGFAALIFAPIAAFTLHWPLWITIALLFLPLLTSLVAAPRWIQLVWLSYAGALLFPVVVLQLAAYLPYAGLENLVWVARDRPRKKGSPVLGPTDVKNVKRSMST